MLAKKGLPKNLGQPETGGGIIRFPPLSGSLRTLLLMPFFASVLAGMALAEDHVVSGPSPVAVQDGVAAVSALNLIEAVPGGRPVVRFAFPDAPQAPVLSDAQTGAAQGMLRRLYARGQAAGHLGDLYDNRDRAHSNLPIGNFPQLTRIAYDRVLRAEGLDYGAALGLIFEAPVLGNSSTALTAGPLWRSLPRFMLTSEGGPRALFQNYASNQIHLYPEHRDHDPEHGIC